MAVSNSISAVTVCSVIFG